MHKVLCEPFGNECFAKCLPISGTIPSQYMMKLVINRAQHRLMEFFAIEPSRHINHDVNSTRTICRPAHAKCLGHRPIRAPNREIESNGVVNIYAAVLSI